MNSFVSYSSLLMTVPHRQFTVVMYWYVSVSAEEASDLELSSKVIVVSDM